jgi:hypothetical protein
MSTELEWENLEQVARVIGERWARRLRAECCTTAKTTGPWPSTLDHARRLLDETLGDRIPRDRREALALILERSARAAWHRSTG